MYCLFGGVIKLKLKCLVGVVGDVLDGGSVQAMAAVIRAVAGGSQCSAPRKKRRKVLHRKRRARAKVRVRKFFRQASVVSLVVCYRRRPSNKPPPLIHTVPTTTSESVHWKWKERNKVVLDFVITRLESSTLDCFCAANNDFLRLPHLLSTLCNHNYHVKQIKPALDRVACLRGTFKMHPISPWPS